MRITDDMEALVESTAAPHGSSSDLGRQPGGSVGVRPRTIAVGVIGYGAIGSVVADALNADRIAGASLAGVCVHGHGRLPIGPTMEFERLLECSDVVVECAGTEAVRQMAVRTLEAGCDLLVLSVGALADDDLLERVASAGPGRLRLSTGALGGLDLVRAARLHGALGRVKLTSTKRPATLAQPWMDEAMLAGLYRGDRRVVVFDGPARDAARLFPRSANVAAALALACGTWDRVETVIVADPQIELTEHDIECSGDAGEYRFTIRNRPSSDNPATSAVVPYAVLRAIADDAAATWRFQ